ncbi:MAG: sigma-70 family RNA polymerase sigma factor [Phycisphaerales bacterium]
MEGPTTSSAAAAEAGAEAQLVDAARRGDRAAFTRLYERFGPVVHGVLLARVRPADADDLVQETFLAAWRRLDSLREDGAFGAWVCAIARHKAATSRRGPDPAGSLPEDLCAPGAAPGGAQSAEHVLAAIRSLPEAYREPLLLRLVESLTGPQIAARTGLTPGSVRVNLHRGMAMLRERLAASTREVHA